MLDEADTFGLNDDVRKQLVDYYKWIVSLATFVLTVSVSLVSLLGKATLQYRGLLIVGWVLLALCVFLNWMLVKRLVSMTVVAAVPTEAEGARHSLFKATLRNMQVYGVVQNAAFLLGILFVGVALVLNIG